jgi:hypothetical protein
MTEAVKSLHSRSEAQWWNVPRSLGDIAEHLERTFKDRQNLERKLTELVEENKRLASRCAKVDAELADTSAGKLKSKTAGHGRQEAELAMRERLLKDEFERKTQELRLEMNKERRQLVECVEQLKKELAGCFCRQEANDYIVHVKKGPAPKASRSPR